MKAARYYGVGDIRIEEVNIPKMKEGDALVRVAWCGICGTDLKHYTSSARMGYADNMVAPSNDVPDPATGDCLPVTLGHEACGIIHETGPGSKLSVGQAVMINPRLYCQTCVECQSRNNQLCPKSGWVGFSGGGGGGFSEFVAVDESRCYPIPADLLDKAALIEPLAVARHGLRSSKIKDFTNKTALVLGGGPIGQAVIHDLKAQGVTQVFVSEPSTVRKQQAERIGAIVFDPKTVDVTREILSRTNETGVDVAFDCAGVPPAAKVGLDSLRKKGVFVMIAATKKIEVPLRVWMVKELSLEASSAYNDDDFRDVVDDFIAGECHS
ncbi:hypothetical protein IL306_007151 [Fusarium sp. DS 682]|nr:hypothetical protein IL306_007151 [Fusarium sp. DS 682]